MVEKQRHAAKVSKKHDVPVAQINGDSLGKDAQTTDPSNECAFKTIKPGILSSANGAAMARTKSRPIKLSPTDREALSALTGTGAHPALQVRRARCLPTLLPGPMYTDTVMKVSKAYAESGGDVQATITERSVSFRRWPRS